MVSYKVCPNKSEHCTEALSETRFPLTEDFCPECKKELVTTTYWLDSIFQLLLKQLKVLVSWYLTIPTAVKFGTFAAMAVIFIVFLSLHSKSPNQHETSFQQLICNNQKHEELTKVVDSLKKVNMQLNRNHSQLSNEMNLAYSHIALLRYLLDHNHPQTAYDDKRPHTQIDHLSDHNHLQSAHNYKSPKTKLDHDFDKPFIPQITKSDNVKVLFMNNDFDILKSINTTKKMFKQNDLSYIFVYTKEDVVITLKHKDEIYQEMTFNKGIFGSFGTLMKDKLVTGDFTLTVKNKEGDKIIKSEEFTVIN
jgi:hypothetical protein